MAVTWEAMDRDLGSPDQAAALLKASMAVSVSMAVSTAAAAEAGVAVAALRQFRRLRIHLH